MVKTRIKSRFRDKAYFKARIPTLWEVPWNQLLGIVVEFVPVAEPSALFILVVSMMSNHNAFERELPKVANKGDAFEDCAFGPQERYIASQND